MLNFVYVKFYSLEQLILKKIGVYTIMVKQLLEYCTMLQSLNFSLKTKFGKIKVSR